MSPAASSPNLFQRLVMKMAASAWFRKVGPKVVPPMDRFIAKVSGGRYTMSGVYLPTLLLTTTGAKSGEARTSPLAFLPDGERKYVVGSNFGQAHHPAWTGNLLKTPAAEIEYRGKRQKVTARMLDAQEKAQVWPKLLAMYPNYDKYVESSGGRDIRVFVLEKA